MGTFNSFGGKFLYIIFPAITLAQIEDKRYKNQAFTFA